MKLIIQNMVCDRCIESVRTIFSGSGIPLQNVELGTVETTGQLTSRELDDVSRMLEDKGFALVLDRESRLIEQIKAVLLSYIDNLENSDKPRKLSVFMTEKLHYNYSYLSSVFSDNTGETVENYLIRLRIERVKELLSYRTLTLSEIAWQLKYSSVQYLSNQFKKITGKTVTEYLKQEKQDRKTLDRL
ncbi:MAG: helix-turn-helix transcriptional regulator [Balneolaceae bacterium]